MDLIVYWSDQAKADLEIIFDYYKTEATLQVARNLINALIESTKHLKNAPQIGPVEPLLQNRANEYRYLVKGNYKIIYFLEGDIINIAMVFDCRQNPIKMK